MKITATEDIDKTESALIRNQITEFLHGGFAPLVTLLREFYYDKTGIVLEGLHFSAYSLLKHMQHRQAALLRFMQDPANNPEVWKEAYWPENYQPESEEAWHNSINDFEKDLEAMIQIIKDPATPVLEVQENGKTISWAAMASFHHNGYHIGQLKAIGRQLGVW